ncbi:PIN domain-containing protein [Hydrogenophaga sp.]|uniref:type II toxin-antitoxin system VapC family toxin n=1 Tax=Hydrogenophaga sp. TaxID=1904254 RepID=UPI002730BAD9|nr:PIN domain-containing protein [Hydrogenophaga sp.]MDP2073337.1 PIN domain-containing protein [Hydrogenophaga sp.]MDP3348865.1 PIN domain-containing protein [Hydrogenophaga sp.]
MTNSTPVVYMDACCFIDMAKSTLKVPTKVERGAHIFFLRKFLEASRAKDASVYTSTITVVECVKVTDDTSPGNTLIDDDEVKRLFRGMLMSGKSGVIPVMPTPRITERARDLRWSHDVTCKPMDAMHLATAFEMKCTHFLTTDGRLGEANIARIKSLGLKVCTADQISGLLPSAYTQMPLPSKKSGDDASVGVAT